MKSLLKRFFDDENGLETIEYAIIAGLITVGVIATVGSIGIWLNSRFATVLTIING